LPNSAPERIIMSGSLFKPAIRRSEISLPGNVTLMSPWRRNSSRCRLRTMRTVVPLASEHCPTTFTIHPNLLDDDDVAYSAHVSLGNQKTVFYCSIFSTILASCARASWSACDHCCRFFPLPHILQTCSSSHSTVLPFWKSTEYLSVCASYARMVPAWRPPHLKI